MCPNELLHEFAGEEAREYWGTSPVHMTGSRYKVLALALLTGMAETNARRPFEDIPGSLPTRQLPAVPTARAQTTREAAAAAVDIRTEANLVRGLATEEGGEGGQGPKTPGQEPSPY
jgi:hypothetical protein